MGCVGHPVNKKSIKYNEKQNILNVRLKDEKGIAILEPEGALSEDDFRRAAGIIDPWIEQRGGLNPNISQER